MDAGWIQVAEEFVMPVATGVGGYFLRSFMDGRRNQQSRLQLTTTRWQPNGLRLEIAYEPESAHTALEAKIALKANGIRLIPGRPVLNPAPMANGGYVRFEFDGQFIGQEGFAPLRPLDGTDRLLAVMFLLPDSSGEWVLRQAEIELAICEARGGRRLLNRRLTISPVEEPANTVFATLAPLNPSFFG